MDAFKHIYSYFGQLVFEKILQIVLLTMYFNCLFKIFLKATCTSFLIISTCLPLKECCPLFQEIQIPVTQECFVSSLFEIDPVVFQEEVEDVKSIWTDRQTDSGQNVIIKAHFSFQLRLTKKMKK